MMKNSFYVIKKQRGQSAMEMGIIVAVVVFAFIAMQTYLKRGIQGHLRDNVDSIGQQYDYDKTTADYSSHEVSNVTSATDTGEQVLNGQTRSVTTVTSVTHYDNSTKQGYEYVGRP